MDCPLRCTVGLEIGRYCPRLSCIDQIRRVIPHHQMAAEMNRLALTIAAAFILIGLAWAMTITLRVDAAMSDVTAGVGLPP